MDAQQQRILLDDVGGEPLEGSGFENERADVEDDVVLDDSQDQKAEKQI